MARDGEAWLRTEISRWVADGTIDEATARKIRERYPSAGETDARKALLTAFSAIGVALVFLGAIVLMAFNWEKIPRYGRVAIAFVPLTLAYGLALFAFLRRDDRPAWRESSCVAAILGFAACAGMLSQIYHIGGEAEDLILLSSALALPFVYALRSNAGTLLYLAALTAWTSLSRLHGDDSLLYWPLFAAIVPRLVLSMRKDRYSSTSAYLGWIVSTSLFVGLGVSLEKALPGLWIVAYALLFACLRMLGSLAFGGAPSKSANPFGSSGFLGIYVLAFMLTYSWPWNEIGWSHYRLLGGSAHWAGSAVDVVVALSLFAAFVLLVVLLVRERRLAPLAEATLALAVVLSYLVVSSLTGGGFIAMLAIHLVMNAVLLAAGVFHAIRGYVSGRLALVNLGAMILVALISFRFVFVEGFFENMISRGLVFMGLGVAFLAANFALSRRLSKGVAR